MSRSAEYWRRSAIVSSMYNGFWVHISTFTCGLLSFEALGASVIQCGAFTSTCCSVHATSTSGNLRIGLELVLAEMSSLQWTTLLVA